MIEMIVTINEFQPIVYFNNKSCVKAFFNEKFTFKIKYIFLRMYKIINALDSSKMFCLHLCHKNKFKKNTFIFLKHS